MDSPVRLRRMVQLDSKQVPLGKGVVVYEFGAVDWYTRKRVVAVAPRLTSAQGAAALLRWNRTYETVRPHQALGYQTPEQSYQDWLTIRSPGKEALSDISYPVHWIANPRSQVISWPHMHPTIGKLGLNVPVLVLNQNYEPLNVCGVRRALVLVLHQKAQLLQNGRGEIHTAAFSYPVPTVIRLFHMARRPLFTRRLSRREVFWRDNFICQYCGRQTREPTLDHVMPRVRGGIHTWDNVVTACVPCNHRKAGRTPALAGMKLLREPRPPRLNPYYQFLHREIPDEWRPFLPWLRPTPGSAPLA